MSLLSNGVKTPTLALKTQDPAINDGVSELPYQSEICILTPSFRMGGKHSKTQGIYPRTVFLGRTQE